MPGVAPEAERQTASLKVEWQEQHRYLSTRSWSPLCLAGLCAPPASSRRTCDAALSECASFTSRHAAP
eukprot:6397403-Lingulodinium_polyedra.AAC.1